jgi:hypothetical protein
MEIMEGGRHRSLIWEVVLFLEAVAVGKKD